MSDLYDSKFEKWFWKISEVITFPVWGSVMPVIAIIAIVDAIMVSNNKLTEDEQKKKAIAVQKIVIRASFWIMGLVAAKYMGWI